MRRILLLGCLAVVLAARMGAAVDREQTVEGLVPPNEQEVQAIGPAAEQGEQGVQGVDTGVEQRVDPQEPASDAARVASKVGNVAIGVMAAAVSLGTTAAMLLFL
jgi:hypothetical protein